MSDYNMARKCEIRSESTSYADNPALLRLSYSKASRPDEVMTVQKYGATVAIDANGGTGTELLITLTELRKDENGDALASVTHSINGNTYDTLGEVAAAINAIEGFKAVVLHAPFSFDTGTANFQDLAATRIPENPAYVDVLLRSVATGNPVYLRFGEPTVEDAGRVKFLSAITSITSATAGNVKLSRDNGVDAIKTLDEVAVSATGKTAYLAAELDDAPTYQGPFLVEFSATSLAGATLTVRHQSAQA